MARTGRPKTPVVLDAAMRERLEAMRRSRTLPAAIVKRARIVLMAADGALNIEIAQTVGLSNSMVGYWRKRFLADGIEGLANEPRSGRPRTISDQRIADTIRATLETKPPGGATHWSTRSMAAASGLSNATVARIWQAFGLQPHRSNPARKKSRLHRPDPRTLARRRPRPQIVTRRGDHPFVPNCPARRLHAKRNRLLVDIKTHIMHTGSHGNPPELVSESAKVKRWSQHLARREGSLFKKDLCIQPGATIGGRPPHPSTL